MAEMSGVRVLERGIAVLSLLAGAEEPLGVSEIGRQTELSKATAFRLLATLVEHDLVIKDPKGNYQIGPKVLFWAGGFNKHSSLIHISKPYIEELNRRTSETVHLFSYDNRAAYYIHRIESPQKVRLSAEIGVNPVLYSTAAGRAILSCLPEEELRDYLERTVLERRTPYTCADPESLREIVRIARERCFSEENQENEEGIRCVGAAIRNSEGYPVGAVSVTAPEYRLPDERAREFGLLIQGVARQISRHFGFRG